MSVSRELLIQHVEGKPGKVYYPYVASASRRLPPPADVASLIIRESPVPTPAAGEVLLRYKAAALNHRDLFIRQSLYPGIDFNKALLADGYGVVVSVGSGVSRVKVGDPVIAAPMRGWASDPVGPEGSEFHVSGECTWGAWGCIAV